MTILRRVAAGAVFIVLCAGCSSSTGSAASPQSSGASGASATSAASSSTDGPLAPVSTARSSTAHGATSTARSATSSGRGSSAATSSAARSSAQALPKRGSWDRTYHLLPERPTVPVGSALKFAQLDYDVISGGWNLNASFKHSGAGHGPIIYFALQYGLAPPTAATPFRLETSDAVKVFMIGAQSPRPTDVIVYSATASGAQGPRELTTPIPASAFAQ